MLNGERIVATNGVELCVETFGDHADPAVLLVHGACASMLGWDEALCRRIAAGGRYVIRFDNRDTGRSVSDPPGAPTYTLRDMADDAIGVLDAVDVVDAHLVGRSMAGAIVAVAALHHPDRVPSLTLISTTTGDPDLSPMSAEFTRAASGHRPDPENHDDVVRFVVDLMEAYAGDSPYHDPEAAQALAERDLARTANIASCLNNHFLIDFGNPIRFSDLAQRTLVAHGDRDPVFPLDHGQALARQIPDAELLVMASTGHHLPPPVWDQFVPALLKHTATRSEPA